MNVIIEPFGNHDNQDVQLFTIQVPNGIKIQLTNFGAAITRADIPTKDGNRQICLGFDSLEEYTKNPPYFGVTVGPVANRIGNARFTLGNKEYQLEVNDGDHCLHSGPGCTFAFKVFRAEVFESEKVSGVVFHYSRPDGEGGFPGNLDIRVYYWVTMENEVIMDYRVTTDSETPVNLTNHAYWNLNGEGSGLVYDHNLTIKSDKYLPVNEFLIPTGKLEDVAADGGMMDFRKTKTIGKDIDETDSGYDHCYILNTNTEPWKPLEYSDDIPRDFSDVLTRSGKVLHAARAEVKNLSMDVFTDQPAVQFYSGNMLKGLIGRQGIAHTPRTAFCLETAGYNNAVNQPEFPSCNLLPGEVYQRTTVHRFHF